MQKEVLISIKEMAKIDSVISGQTQNNTQLRLLNYLDKLSSEGDE